MPGGAKKDATRGLRLNKIIDRLNKKTPYGGVTVKELAEMHEVSTRQIYRDLNAIENGLHVPLVRKQNGRTMQVCLEAGYLPALSPEKATIVYLSMLQQKGSALSGHLNEIKDALIATLFRYHYDPRELAVEKLQKRIHFVEESLTGPEKVAALFATLVNSIRDSHRVKIWYFATWSGQQSERVVEPYGLICKHNNWYLVGRCLKKNDIRVFRVDQIQDVLAYATEHFLYPAGFSLAEFMASSWGVINDGKTCLVRLKFNRQVAHRVKNVLYHPSQKLETELPDGSAIVTFEACGLDEMIGWLSQWGDLVEVLEPRWLREKMRMLAEKMAQVYEKD
ncbi:helix-turn-helix transcriptional regulator [Desulfotomaculum copahuensis]|uniref:Transcriptional regulator n=1 Tax=Desulfotomaculum copahuensis TaxID=1838280 RepID=A0A1B7LD70_9FIRM|nr:WYL domain-containing protein [Desulfotomaculum copahuensis]OAT81058.1 transcriptional regulator [Desulfotomaculum copahuensis]